jgi:hypothetical protein
VQYLSCNNQINSSVLRDLFPNGAFVIVYHLMYSVTPKPMQFFLEDEDKKVNVIYELLEGHVS